MRHYLLAYLVILPIAVACAQPGSQLDSYTGWLSLGGRSTVSAFGTAHGTGTGVGGQFRIQLNDRINTEWFADLITTDIQGKANRTDYHIGWSVFYYPGSGNTGYEKTMKPFILAGHCFDYTRVAENRQDASHLKRWSSAIQAGAGNHFNLTPLFDLSLTAQYMIHLGSDIRVHVHDNLVVLEEHKGSSLEGHLLITLSVNHKIGKLW